jgi:3-oxoacyl-[acyl-carrier-protein] synthase III
VKATRGIRIAEIEYELPVRVVSNRDLERQFPDWNMAALEEKSGIRERHIAEENQTALDLAREASVRLLARAGVEARDLQGIVFCTQTPEYLMPSNAFLLHEALGMTHGALAFDYNLACSGYIYGLAIVQGLVEIGLADRVLLVTADTYSKYINERDRSTRCLFGDGAAASLIEVSGAGSPSRLVDVMLASSGREHRAFYIPAGGCRLPSSERTREETTDDSGNTRSLENIHMNGFAVWRFIATEVPKQIAQLLARNSLGVADVDLYVFHQASKLTLDSLVTALRIPREKVFLNMESIGNTVSASIPIALADAARCGRLQRGQLVLLSGFGVGLSWGTALMRY